MSGYMMVYGPCYTCKHPFNYNPNHVPSYRFNGRDREPLCLGCMNRTNAQRKDAGLDPFPIHPNAYEPEPA